MMLAWTDSVLQEATPAKRCLIVLLLTVPFYLTYIFLHALALWLPTVRESVRVDVVMGLQFTLVGTVAVFLLIAMWLWPRRHGHTSMPTLYAALACLSSVPFLAISISQGIFTSPSNLVIIGNVAVGFLLLDARAVMIGFGMAVFILGLYDVAVMIDLMPYAPLFLPRAFNAGEPEPWWAIARNLILGISILVYSLLAVVFFHQFESQRRTLRKLSNTDVLTGLSNRRFFMTRLTALCEKNDKDNRPFALAIIDADHFKRVNDTYGHAIGDEVLCAIAATLARAIPGELHVVARLGGEEFGVLLENTPLDSAVTLLESAAEQVRILPFRATDVTFNVTLSMGLVECQNQSPEACMSLADRNLYHAKHGGRDQIIASHATAPVMYESLHRLA